MAKCIEHMSKSPIFLSEMLYSNKTFSFVLCILPIEMKRDRVPDPEKCQKTCPLNRYSEKSLTYSPLALHDTISGFVSRNSVGLIPNFLRNAFENDSGSL